jgi:nicotinate-nucleotide adenylyltransferase
MKLSPHASSLGPSNTADRTATRVAFSGGSRVAFFGGSFDPPHNGHLAVARAARAAFALDVVLFAPVGMQPLKPEGPAASFEDRMAMTRLAIAGEPGFQVSLADAPKPPDSPKPGVNRTSESSYTPNYTIDTLEQLRTSLAPDGALFCLMGADSFFTLRRWHRAAEIPFVAPLIVASRPGQPLQDPNIVDPSADVNFDLNLDLNVDLKVDLEAALPSGLAFESAPEESRSESGIEVRSYILMNQAGARAPFYVLPSLHVEISASEIRAQIQAAPGSPAAERDLVPPAVREYIAQHTLYRS